VCVSPYLRSVKKGLPLYIFFYFSTQLVKIQKPDIIDLSRVKTEALCWEGGGDGGLVGGLGLVGLGFRHCEDHQEDIKGGGKKLDRQSKLGDVAFHHARKTLLCLQK
jgi:hypothetical protein